MTEPLTTERIDGEFYYAEYDGIWWHTYRKDATGEDVGQSSIWKEDGELFVKHLDEQARHHREAERQKINEAADATCLSFHAFYGRNGWQIHNQAEGDYRSFEGPDFLTALTQASTQGESA